MSDDVHISCEHEHVNVFWVGMHCMAISDIFLFLLVVIEDTKKKEMKVIREIKNPFNIAMKLYGPEQIILDLGS